MNDQSPTPETEPDDDRSGRPLVVNAAALHALVDEMSRALHSYVDVAVGVRAEFDAETADDDPRVELAEAAIERLNTAFDEQFESDLGMTSAHTSYAWDEESEDEEDDSEYESLQLEMMLERAGHTDAELDEALELLDTAAQSLAQMLESRGFEVPQWACSHERYLDDDEVEDGDEDEHGPVSLTSLGNGFDGAGYDGTGYDEDAFDLGIARIVDDELGGDGQSGDGQSGDGQSGDRQSGEDADGADRSEGPGAGDDGRDVPGADDDRPGA